MPDQNQPAGVGAPATSRDGAAAQSNGGGNSGNSGNANGTNNNGASLKEARIHARKIRIEAARMAKMKPEKIEESDVRRKPKVEIEKKDAGKARLQTSVSNAKIDSIKLSTTELVTNIRVGIVARESQRRLDDVKKSELWAKKRTDDAGKTADMQDDINSQWSKIFAVNSDRPYELNDLLSKQKEACDALMASKNKLMNEYMVDLKAKDDDYVKELKRQAEEIDTLIARMEEQYRSMQVTLREELEQIEKAFIDERTELIETNRREIETLFENRRENEAKYLEERAERIGDHLKQLEALRVRDAEEYNLVKIKLETDVQVLEQQLQQMRATYQLNTEKLEYNFQVLKKREEENASILATQKRKITRLTDHLNLLKQKMTKQERVYQQEYVSLTEDYKRILEQYKELQKKFRHFQISDNAKYSEIWTMNEESTMELVRKVIAADRIIVEQQLGMKWEGPKQEFLEKSLMFATKGAKETITDDDERVRITGMQTSNFNGNTGDLEEHSTDPAMNSRDSLAAKFKETKLSNAPAGYSKTMKRMLELLCNEAGFLVEEKLQKLLAPLHKDEQSLMKLDSIFKALSVETVEDIEKLTSFFVARAPINSTSANANKEANITLSENSTQLTSLIHPNDVIRAIRKFVEDHRVSKATSGRHASFEDQDDQSEGILEDSDKMTKKQVANETKTTSKVNQHKMYWENMACVIDDKTYRIWMGVHAAMKKYNALLTERCQLTQEIDAVRTQSEELKGLLRQYMSAKVNDELEVPPTQIMWHAAGANVSVG
ncbi:hypothetical protein HDU83_000531 [Entophlyctis luteolus]|nr:hypothetical protein HDU83_000531 [Entophlyctis luteolus]